MNIGGSGGWSDFPLDTCLVSPQISPCCSHTHTSLATHDDTTCSRIRTRSTSHTLVAANTRPSSSFIKRLWDHSHFQEQQQGRSVIRQSSLCCRSQKGNKFSKFFKISRPPYSGRHLIQVHSKYRKKLTFLFNDPIHRSREVNYPFNIFIKK